MSDDIKRVFGILKVENMKIALVKDREEINTGIILSKLPSFIIKTKTNSSFFMSANITNKEREPRTSTAIESMSGTLNKNFFLIEDVQHQDFNQEMNDKRPKQKPHRRISERKQNRMMKLEPMSEADHHQIELPNNMSKNEEVMREGKELGEIKKEEKSKSNFRFEISSEEDEKEEEVETVHIKENTKKEENVPVEDQQKEPKPKYQEPAGLTYENENSENSDEEMQENLQSRNQMLASETFVPRKLEIKNCISFSLKRDKEWLNRFWPQFNMHSYQRNEYALSAKLTGNNSASTFVMSKNKEDFTENGEYYIGKVKSNFMGNVINIFGKGYNPSDHMNKGVPLRSLLATVEYETNFFGEKRPRSMKVYVLRPGIDYYEHLEGTIKGEEEIPLSELYLKTSNKNKILAMVSRRPEWNSNIKGYMLYFGGRVKVASIKNFILEDEDEPDNARLLFGKLDEDEFRIDVGAPLTPYVGLGIALSTFGGKIGCE